MIDWMRPFCLARGCWWSWHDGFPTKNTNVSTKTFCKYIGTFLKDSGQEKYDQSSLRIFINAYF